MNLSQPYTGCPKTGLHIVNLTNFAKIYTSDQFLVARDRLKDDVIGRTKFIFG